jgi:hypothetical protein
VFAVPPLGITNVTFYIDGVLVQNQFFTPYDMMGSTGGGRAKKYTLPGSDGTMVVTVVTHFIGGATQTASATISYS